VVFKYYVLISNSEQYEEFKNKVINTLINQLLSRGPLLIFDSFFGKSGNAGVMTALDALTWQNAGFTQTFIEQLKSKENTNRIQDKQTREEIQQKIKQNKPLTWQEEIELLKAIQQTLEDTEVFDLQVKQQVEEAIKEAEETNIPQSILETSAKSAERARILEKISKTASTVSVL